MKRRALLRHLHNQGCEPLREGGRHTIYWNPASEQTAPIPRHAEIADLLARKICDDLGVSRPGQLGKKPQEEEPETP